MQHSRDTRRDAFAHEATSHELSRRAPLLSLGERLAGGGAELARFTQGAQARPTGHQRTRYPLTAPEPTDAGAAHFTFADLALGNDTVRDRGAVGAPMTTLGTVAPSETAPSPLLAVTLTRRCFPGCEAGIVNDAPVARAMSVHPPVPVADDCHWYHDVGDAAYLSTRQVLIEGRRTADPYLPCLKALLAMGPRPEAFLACSSTR